MRDSRPYAERREWIAPGGYGVSVTEPIEGFYKIKLGRGSVTRGVRLIYGPPNDPVTGEVLDRSWRWMAILDDGALAMFDDIWPACAANAITEADYNRYCQRVEWARRHAPDSAYAGRGRKIDLLSSLNPLPF